MESDTRSGIPFEIWNCETDIWLESQREWLIASLYHVKSTICGRSVYKYIKCTVQLCTVLYTLHWGPTQTGRAVCIPEAFYEIYIGKWKKPTWTCRERERERERERATGLCAPAAREKLLYPRPLTPKEKQNQPQSVTNPKNSQEELSLQK